MFHHHPKTPLAWLQLMKEKSRLLVAVAGIAFADLLMFFQLGMLDSLYDSATSPHRNLQADLVLINRQVKTLIDMKSFTRERLQQAVADNGVASVSAVYVGTVGWRNPDTHLERSILLWGIDPVNPAFTLPKSSHSEQLQLLNRVLFDRASRPEYGPIAQRVSPQGLEVQVSDRPVQVVGLFTLGASFGADGNLIASNSTFLHLIGDRSPDQIDIGLVQLQPGADRETVQKRLRANLPNDVQVLTIPEFVQLEIDFWASGGTGFIFKLGVFVGFTVGIVIVYSNVSEHLAEYATLKAMGYSDRFLLVMLMQEALLLAALGFLPGLVISIGLYRLTYAATLLPIAIKFNRALVVFVLTLLMCGVSGLLATRKLRAVDPADVF